MSLLSTLLSVSGGGSSNDKGYFVNQAALEAAYPTGEAGWYAVVGSTDTFWIWDTDTSAWVDSGDSSSGDVVGPASSINNNVAVFDGLTGKIIKDSGVSLASKQDVLVSGTNIKTINGNNLLSGGDLVISGGAVDSVNGQTGVVVLDADDISDSTTTNKFTTASDITKLAGIEAGAEVNNISDANATDLTDGGDTTLHTHDSRYYTESEIDTFLSNKQNSLGFTPEDVSNKENTTIDTSTTKYPTVNLLKTGLDTKLNSTAAAGGDLSGNYPNPTILNSAVLAKVLTGFTSGAGTVSASDTILQAIQKLDGNIGAKQDTLVSGTNIKTINGDSLLGSGNLAIPNFAVINENTIARILALSDAYKYIRCTNALATSITVPLNSSVAFEIDTEIIVWQQGEGVVSFVATGGVTINAPALSISNRYKSALLKKVGTNEWDLIVG